MRRTRRRSPMAIAAVGGGTAGLVKPIGAPGLDARVALATTHMQVGARTTPVADQGSAANAPCDPDARVRRRGGLGQWGERRLKRSGDGRGQPSGDVYASASMGNTVDRRGRRYRAAAHVDDGQDLQHGPRRIRWAFAG